MLSTNRSCRLVPAHQGMNLDGLVNQLDLPRPTPGRTMVRYIFFPPDGE